MTTMIEKMARAIYFGAEDQGDMHWDHAPSWRKSVATEQAIVALTALLEPSGAMLQAYYNEPLDDPQYATSDDEATKRFQAMIRTALDEVE